MIRISPLKLKRYIVEEIHVVARTLVLAEPQPVPELLADDLEVAVEHFQNEAFPNEMLCRLLIKLKESEKPVPYAFAIRIGGLFEIGTEGLSTQQRDTHIRFSMPSLLWAVARDVLVTQMAKGPYPPVILPVVTFLPEHELLKPGRVTGHQRPKI
jgi:preprotein translocase subunit SecB